MTTFIEPLELTMVDRDMSPNTSILFTVFLGACMGGFCLYDMYKKQKQTEDTVKELEHEIGEVEGIQQTHSDILQEQEQRLREKKNYDESEEVQEGKYQAWIGTSKSIHVGLTVRIWREKISTIKKNLEWKSWDETPDGSCVVRDFYLGNSNPDFAWKVKPLSDVLPISAAMEDTVINGWDSICKIEVFLLGEKKDMLQFVNKENFEGSATCNLVLKKCIDDKLIVWSRALIDA